MIMKKETMAQAFPYDGGIKGLKDPKKCLDQVSKNFLLGGKRSSF